MLRVSIEQARPGMVLAQSILDPNTDGHVLLKTGFELNEDYIKRLRILRVYSAWIHYPGLDFLDNVIDQKMVDKQQKLYGSLKEEFAQAQQDQGLSNINYGLFVDQLTALFSRMVSVNCESAHFIDELHGNNQDLFHHGTQVASLAMLIGMRLDSHIVRCRPNTPPSLASCLTPLGLGCLLHDVGKMGMTEEEINFKLTAQDRGSQHWQSHTEVGYTMIKGGLDPLAGQIVLNHHQHFDGSGFPKRNPVPGTKDPYFTLKGDDIHVFGRIATLADRFINFRHLPDGRVAPNIVALKRLNNPGYIKWFDPIVFKAFTDAMPAFGIGESVTLNNGQEAVVTQINAKAPCRPTVRPVDLDKATGDIGPEGQQAQVEDINLQYNSELSIAKVGDFDVSTYLF
ncbi:MAG: HD domain-containing protein [Phycisphaerae bacterium]|nr:HD domain-containing protein [Phycisphaerae bacterium]